MTCHARNLKNELLDRFGPLVGGTDLMRLVGCRSPSTFKRAIRKKTLKIPIFDIPGRRGKFALTADVAAWLSEISGSSQKPVENSSSDSAGEVGSEELADASEEAKM